MIPLYNGGPSNPLIDTSSPLYLSPYDYHMLYIDGAKKCPSPLNIGGVTLHHYANLVETKVMQGFQYSVRYVRTTAHGYFDDDITPQTPGARYQLPLSGLWITVESDTTTTQQPPEGWSPISSTYFISENYTMDYDEALAGGFFNPDFSWTHEYITEGAWAGYWLYHLTWTWAQIQAKWYQIDVFEHEEKPYSGMPSWMMGTALLTSICGLLGNPIAANTISTQLHNTTTTNRPKQRKQE